MIHIVYPYKIPVFSGFGWELKYSLRSLYKHLKEDFDVTVIGDIPDWLNTREVNCVALKNDYRKCQRQSKINEKILRACNFYDEFLVFNDDIYIMEETRADVLKIPRYISDTFINYTDPTFHKPNSFGAQLKNSFFKLKELGIEKQRNYVSHTPHFYKTEILKEIQEKIDLSPETFPSVVIENIYHNYVGETGRPASEIRSGYWLNVGEWKRKLLLNHDETGANKNQWIKPLLEKTFPEKCKAEL